MIKYKKGFILFLLVIFMIYLYPDEETDLHHTNDIFSDSLYTFTESDTLADVFKPAVFDSLHYSADSLYYFVDVEKIMLTGSAEIKYGRATIKADSISIDFERDQAKAHGRLIMDDNDQLILGTHAYYDINTETGLVFSGASRLELGYYYGQEIRKVGDEVFDLDYGRFTTCDAYHPHFDFRGNSMRVYLDHMVVAKPLFLYVNELPILVFPYASISIKRGRQSGFLIPEPGFNVNDGKYFRNLAYFWAFNDYSDLVLGMDLLEKKGQSYFTDMIYLNNKKNYNGRLLGRYHHNVLSPDSYRTDWQLNYNHVHRLPERATFLVSLNLASSSLVWENDTDANKRLQERLTSTITYNKPSERSSFFISGKYEENLLTNQKDIILPNFRYSLLTRQIQEYIPIIPDDVRRGEHWWKNFTINWSLEGIHTGKITDPNPSFAQVIFKNERDSTGVYLSEHKAAIRQVANISWTHTMFGWLTLGSRLTYRDAIMDRDREGNYLVHGYNYSTNHNVSFPIYGIRQFQSSPIQAIRHTLNPSATFLYVPDFYEQNKNFDPIGGLSASRRQRMFTFSLRQGWDVRFRDGDNDRGKTMNKLIGHSVSTSYDMEKEERPWGDLIHSADVNPGSFQIMNITVTPSQKYTATQLTYEDFYISSWTVRNELIVSGDANYYNYFPYQLNDFATGNFFPVDTLSTMDRQIRTIRDLERLENPGSWSVTINHDYSVDRRNKRKTQGLHNSMNVKITENWSASYSNQYDLDKNDLVSQSLTINRDIHCWKLTMTYTMSAYTWDYRVVFFNMKLPDSLRLQNRGYAVR